MQASQMYFLSYPSVKNAHNNWQATCRLQPKFIDEHNLVENVDSAPTQQYAFQEQLPEHDTEVDISNNVPILLADLNGAHMSDDDKEDDESDNSEFSSNNENGDEP
ncbi:hypothetical protein Scep_006945 [Stephania cephalantha]|uniref:Uncharacterized protein n=1 Tax=Stephania cephalantha TaxID=152367 RepID=A0AAP0KAM8_9MAGN